MALPDKFKCVVTNWDYVYTLCRDLSNKIRESGYEPDVIVALARGGWVAGRILCDFLGLSDLASLKVEHYTGTAITGEGAVVRYQLSSDAVEGKNVLIADDIADTGKSLIRAEQYVLKKNPKDVKIATLQYLETTQKIPDYYGEFVETWAWIIYPWNFMEDMIDLIGRLFIEQPKKRWDLRAIISALEEKHEMVRVNIEVAQLSRLDEVVSEMVYRGIINQFGSVSGRYWQLAAGGTENNR